MSFANGRVSPDLICFSHLRWGFVYQRPQHVMTRLARDRRVFFVEEPVFDAQLAHLVVTKVSDVYVAVPHLVAGTAPVEQLALQRRLLDGMISGYRIDRPVAWFYTPMALPLIDGGATAGIVFDCMDELSGFANAPADMRERERELLARADVVFTGGYSLFEAKRARHANIHPFPSGVDVAHFAAARGHLPEPADQRGIAQPRIGFCGVIDERMNRELVGAVARMRPDWQFVMIGPVVKIDPADLPRSANIHYLGMKSYDELPNYLGGWAVAMMPFAHNDATRFISPTKTPEYLAAGCPVVSTSIRDVVRPYGEEHLVEIADTADAFVAAIARAMTDDGSAAVARAQARLAQMSWECVVDGMRTHVEAIEPREPVVTIAIHHRLSPGVPATSPAS
jgi:glycosyltransferase involved in cell wall biosynthesis